MTNVYVTVDHIKMIILQKRKKICWVHVNKTARKETSTVTSIGANRLVAAT